MSLSDNGSTNQSGAMVERKSDRELVVTRSFKAPARLVFEAWTKPELFRQWWAPTSFGVTIVSHEADIRTGGKYCLMMDHASLAEPMAFFGKYLEVTPPSRLVWTNDENLDDGAVTTVTFTETDGETLVVLSDLHASKEALDEAIASGSTSGWGEQLAQLEQLLVSLGAPIEEV